MGLLKFDEVWWTLNEFEWVWWGLMGFDAVLLASCFFFPKKWWPFWGEPWKLQFYSPSKLLWHQGLQFYSPSPPRIHHAFCVLERLSVATECSPIKLGPHMAGGYKIGTLCWPMKPWLDTLQNWELHKTLTNYTKPTCAPIELKPTIKLEPLKAKFKQPKKI